MKNVGALFGAILLFAAIANAQANPTTTSTTPATDALYAFVPAAAESPAGVADSASGTSDSADQKPTVQGVFQRYDWQAYGGYTFIRFYATPQITNNMNGFNFGLVYYPGGKWFGPDGEFVAAFGSYGPYTTKFVAGLGGGRVRWSLPRGVEVWGHGLAGISNLLPQTALGNQSAFVYEVGGGVDININRKRLALRVSGDMLGTSYFSTHQYSPKISAGIVFKY